MVGGVDGGGWIENHTYFLLQSTLGVLSSVRPGWLFELVKGCFCDRLMLIGIRAFFI